MKKVVPVEIGKGCGGEDVASGRFLLQLAERMKDDILDGDTSGMEVED